MKENTRNTEKDFPTNVWNLQIASEPHPFSAVAARLGTLSEETNSQFVAKITAALEFVSQENEDSV